MSASSRTAVKQFVIDNTSTAIPSGVSLFKAIKTSRYEPKIATLGSNVVCWIGETRRKVTRLSLGRGGGQKLAEWNVQVMVIGSASDEVNGIDQFQAVVDNIAESYETISLSPPPTITDPVDGGTSQITIIGETWTDVMYRPEFTADQGRITFRAIITVPASEYLASS